MTRFLLILLLLLSSWTFVGCPTSGDDDDSATGDDDDATGDDDDATGDDDDATGDDDDATGDDDDATGDDDDSAGDDDDSAGDDDDATGEQAPQEFLDNGPAEGYFWEPSDMARNWTVDECNAGSPLSWQWIGEGIDISDVEASQDQFDVLINGATLGASPTTCTWDAYGAWNCASWSSGQDLNNLPPPQNIPAYITTYLTISGQFGPLTGSFGSEDEHTYGYSYSSIITIDLEMECSGTGCATAQSASGVDAWPCTSTVVQWVANVDDPGLPSR